jgi:hypothetical protein
MGPGMWPEDQAFAPLSACWSIPMKHLLITLSLACSAGLALAHGCPKEMAAIDARLATNPKLSDADKAKVQKLRADGEAAHKAGKHDESMKLLAEAKKTLGI